MGLTFQMNIDGFIFIRECIFNTDWSKEEKVRGRERREEILGHRAIRVNKIENRSFINSFP